MARDDTQRGTRAQGGTQGGTQTGRDVDISAGQRVKTLITVIVEMIPGGLGPWGVGDVVTAIEAIFGRTIDGLKLTGSERLVYLGASAIPVLPARPIVAIYRRMSRETRPQE